MSRSLVNSPQDGPWVLVTSAFHMYRSLGSFCAAGWREMIPYPVDFRSSKTLEFRRPRFAEHINVLNVGVHEWIGLIIYDGLVARSHFCKTPVRPTEAAREYVNSSRDGCINQLFRCRPRLSSNGIAREHATDFINSFVQIQTHHC